MRPAPAPDDQAPSARVTLCNEPFVPGALLGSMNMPTAMEHLTGVGLVQEERAVLATLPTTRRIPYAAGRTLLRAAVQRIAPDQTAWPLLHTPRGGPALPPGLTGSLSHKATRVIALAASATAHGSAQTVGVDLEHRPTERDADRPDLSTRICTDRERATLPTQDALQRRERTLLHFAVKEAVYKAIDPLVQRYVAFREVELDLTDDPDTPVRLLMDDPIMTAQHVHAQWRIEGPWIIALARCTPR